MHSVTSNAVFNALTIAQSSAVISNYDFYFNSVSKIGNIVNIRLELYGGKEPLSANTAHYIGTLPEGFRPNDRLGLEVGNINSGNGRMIEMWHCDINYTGGIILYMTNSALDFAYINVTFII
jgi:hypothetical protein